MIKNHFMLYSNIKYEHMSIPEKAIGKKWNYISEKIQLNLGSINVNLMSTWFSLNNKPYQKFLDEISNLKKTIEYFIIL